MTQPSDAYELPEDLFGREAIAEKLKGLLESDIDLSPMVIDGDWGIGKTVFCHRLINKINESEKLNCVYIDAFRADHIDDPLISIISEIGKLVEKNGGEGKLDSFIDGAKPFIRTAAKTLGKAAVSFTLRQSTDDIAEGYDKEVEALAGVSIDASIDLIIRDKINAEKNLDTLHGALKEVTKEKELIILIDELDRCRATFAIDLLETIKHTFSIKKIKIVIITNATLLETAFRHRYGGRENTKNYFEKFYKYKYTLPSEKMDTLENSHRLNLNSHVYFKYIVSKNDSIAFLSDEDNLFSNGFEELINYNNISLRKIKNIIKNIEIINHFDHKLFNRGLEPSPANLIILLAVYLYTEDPKLVQKASRKNRKRNSIDRHLTANTFNPFDKINTPFTPIEAIIYIIDSDLFAEEEGSLRDQVLHKAATTLGSNFSEVRENALNLFKDVFYILQLNFAPEE